MKTFEARKREIWNRLINDGSATEDELVLVTSIMGYSTDSLEDVLFARTGYRSIEEMDEEVDDE